MSTSSRYSGFRVKIVFVFAIIILCSTAVGAEINTEGYSLDGVAVQMGEEWEANYQSQADPIFDRMGIEKPSNAVLYAEPLGDRYVLFTEEEIKTSSISGSGKKLVEGDGDSLGVMVAGEVETSTDGIEMSNQMYQEHKDGLVWEFVEVTGGVNTVSYTLDPGNEFVQQHSTVYIGDSHTPSPILEQPGREGRWATLNLSGDEYGHLRGRELVSKTRVSGSPTIATKYEGTQWWVSSKATVRGVVMGSGDVEATGLVVREVSPDATEIGGPSSARSHMGEVVTFTTNGLGSRISSQETLLAAKKCAPSSVSNPVTGCLPIPADSVIHSGVLFGESAESADDTVIYAGAANRKQSQPVREESGQYEVTGRVVDASSVDPRLDGIAVVVYDRERVGDLSVNPVFAEESATVVESHLKEQIKTNQSEWDSVERKQANGEDGNSKSEIPEAAETETPAQEPDIEIVSSEIGLEEIEPGQTSAIKIKLQNSGGDGSEKLMVKAERETIYEESVQVRGGKSKTVPVTFEPRNGNGTYEISANGDRVGTIQVGQPESGYGETLSSAIGLIQKFVYASGFVGVGIALLITVLRPIKEYRGSQTNLTDAQNYHIIYGSLLLAIFTSFIAGEGGISIVFAFLIIMMGIIHGAVEGLARLYEAV